MTTELELIANYHCHTGEGPLWHPDEKRLYWLDIPAGKLFRYDPATGHHEQCYQAASAIGGFTIQTDGSLLLFMERGAIKIWRGGQELDNVIDEILAERVTRFNDVIADPGGRVFCGTMPSGSRSGRLYRLDPDGTLQEVVGDVGVSNGLGFTPDRRRMYYTDTSVGKIYVFDYDAESGELSNQEVFATVEGDGGVPDGMTVDADGYVWSARWDGWRLVRYAPDGSIEREIEFPVKKVSCITFGGDALIEMYVTTAGGDDPAENGELAGGLFRLDLGIQGLPEYRSNVLV